MTIRVGGGSGAGRVNPGSSKPSSAGGDAGARFTLPEAERAEGTTATTAARATATISAVGLLALQSVETSGERQKRARRRGIDMLDQLDRLKIDLLEGGVPLERLSRIVETMRRRESSGDSGLDALLEEIELRARVELAKLGHFPD